MVSRVADFALLADFVVRFFAELFVPLFVPLFFEVLAVALFFAGLLLVAVFDDVLDFEDVVVGFEVPLSWAATSERDGATASRAAAARASARMVKSEGSRKLLSAW